MKDEALTVAPGLSKAEAAVSYVLQRIRVDADLRWHMLGTEAFNRLCAAEAERKNKPIDEVATFYEEPAAHCLTDTPKLVMLRRAINKACRESSSERQLGEKVTEYVLPLV